MQHVNHRYVLIRMITVSYGLYHISPFQVGCYWLFPTLVVFDTGLSHSRAPLQGLFFWHNSVLRFFILKCIQTGSICLHLFQDPVPLHHWTPRGSLLALGSLSGHVGSCGLSLYLGLSLGMTLELPLLQPEPHSCALIPTPLFLQQVATMMCTYGKCRNFVSVWPSEYCNCSLLKSCQALLVHAGPW